MSHTHCFVSSFWFSCLSLHLGLIPSEDGAKNGPWKLAWFSVACFAFNSDPSAILYIFNLGLEALMFRKSLCDCCFDSFTAVGKHEQCFTLQLPYYPERKLTFPDLRSF